ncbi:GumC family protein [Aquimarina hainanensis]|uniref:non-specific protein-tyrosine kinase n=1 Tax=Aquimarina hainanensis TaxID=1578017 RepID=A0ABW5NAT6_9FLAO|nr:polysaccharide biosynthesis tyrosine autokinase [Aquimarina sp. TRL1]QKX06850.1 polysaccharide biosynthesis tyrosine autokinase [Aquimarina sp. TRL1]
MFSNIEKTEDNDALKNAFNTNGKSTTSITGYYIREQIIRYLKKWYWFLLGAVICVSIAFLKIRYTIPQYSVSSTVLISQDDNIGQSELSAFKDLGILDDTRNAIENELQIIKSRRIISNVVDNLKLNVQYFTDGRILEVESYPKAAVEINFLSEDSIVKNRFKHFNVLVNSETSFSLVDKDGNVINEHSFGKTINTSIGDVVITPNVDVIKANIGKIIKIKISPVANTVERYREKISVGIARRGSSIVRISLSDGVKQKATDILNNLVEEYNKFTIGNKKTVSARTADFINNRLDLISGDLSEVDDEAAGYKSKFGLTNNIETQTERVADIDSRNVQEISRLNTKLSLIESMRRFILSQEGRYDLIPSNLGFDDITITNNVGKYNALTLQRKRLLKTSSVQNPVVVNIDEQIDGLRQVLIGSLNSLKSTIKIQLGSLQTQDRYFSGKLYNAPKRQKDLRVIEREQTIKEQLYLYLLQKREEAEITSHITLSNTKVIDKASVLSARLVSPNKKMTYLVALLAGLLIPFVIIYLSDLLNIRVSSKEELEKNTSMPMLGTIPIIKNKAKIVISRTSRSGISEAFRILRTNLDFLMAGNAKKTGKVVFVTSTISGEGKTLISCNLAKTLAISGKKVIFVGTDFRDPKFHEFVKLPNGKETVGFTNYIMTPDLSPEDVILHQETEDPFDILCSGVIPPNPAELLMQDKVKVMFEYLEKNYDYVVVDTAPVSLVTDTLLISALADICIYVVRENYSDKRILEIPENLYQNKRLPNMAVLLNASRNKLGYSYGYGYGK